MAQILANGLIQFSDGRVLYSDTPLTGQDFMELAQLLPQISPAIGRAAMVGFPFISGGGGGQGPQGPAGPPGPSALGFASIFRFSHTSGSLSTGPLGFTPKFCIYTGVAVKFIIAGNQAGTMFTGFAFGSLAAQQATGAITVNWDGLKLAGATMNGVLGAIAGAVNFNDASFGFNPSIFDSNLVVTLLDATGITLTWSSAVQQHIGSLLVIG